MAELVARNGLGALATDATLQTVKDAINALAAGQSDDWATATGQALALDRLDDLVAKLPATPATSADIAGVVAKLPGDPATNAQLTAVLNKLSADPATNSKLDAVITALSAINFASGATVFLGPATNDIGNVRLKDAGGSAFASRAGSAASTSDRGLVVALHPSSPLPSGSNVIGSVDIAGFGTKISATSANTAASASQNAIVTAFSPNTALPTGDNVIGRANNVTAMVTDDIAGSVNAVSTTLAAFDCKDMKSISIQTSATAVHTGTLIFEVSNDGQNWYTKSLIRSSDGIIVSSFTTTNAAIGIVALHSGDIGARYFRVRQSAWTVGTVRITAQLSSQAIATIPQQGVLLNSGINTVGAVLPSAANAASTTAFAAANATTTLQTVDQGAGSGAWRRRLRVGVLHTAGLTPGHLVIQESTDATTYFETRRVPIPSDGLMHVFEFPLTARGYKVLFVNGAVAQTGFRLYAESVGVDGPTLDAQTQTLSFQLPVSLLAAGAQFTGPILDLGPRIGKF
jgi:hypothetical protein